VLLHAGRDARLAMGVMVDWLERDSPTEKRPVRP